MKPSYKDFFTDVEATREEIKKLVEEKNANLPTPFRPTDVDKYFALVRGDYYRIANNTMIRNQRQFVGWKKLDLP